MKPIIRGSSPALTVERRGPGRPLGTKRVQEPGSTVSAWLPASVHDKLVQVAKSQETSVSAILKQVIIINLVNVNIQR